MPRNTCLNVVFATVTPQFQVKFEVGSIKRVDNGPTFFVDNGPMANPPPTGSMAPQSMGLTTNE